MSKLALSTTLFAGAIVYFAEEATATSDPSTKPASNSALWLEVGKVQSLIHNPEVQEEKYAECGANGWTNGKEVYTLADVYELVTREVSELYHRLDLGVSAAMVAGTAQQPFAKSTRSVKGWIKVQNRKHDGTDRLIHDMYCEIRIKKAPAIERKTMEPTLELYVQASTLNSVVIPS